MSDASVKMQELTDDNTLFFGEIAVAEPVSLSLLKNKKGLKNKNKLLCLKRTMIHLHIENYYIPYILGWFRSKERVSVRKDLLNHFVYVPFLGSEKEKKDT